mgnify:CR=1 FL=1
MTSHSLQFILRSTLSAGLIFSSASGLAQQPNKDFGLPAQTVPFKEWEQKGNLFDIKIIPGKKQTKLYLVGKETATLEFKKLSVVGKIKVGNNEKTIEFRRDKDYFTTSDEIKGDSLQIHAEDKASKKQEKFEFDLKKP